MGPRLSTGGNVEIYKAAPRPIVVLQWGPVSRRGGTTTTRDQVMLLLEASMGPRLSTGGNRRRDRGARPRERGFNGAPSLDGGELGVLGLGELHPVAASMGP